MERAAPVLALVPGPVAVVLEHGGRAGVLVEVDQVRPPGPFDVGEAYVGPVEAFGRLDLAHVQHATRPFKPGAHGAVGPDAEIVGPAIATVMSISCV